MLAKGRQPIVGVRHSTKVLAAGPECCWMASRQSGELRATGMRVTGQA